MGGKTSTSSSQVSIPPEVLARYNSVNTQAQQVAATPFQQYSTNPNAFVAPVNAQQYAGIGTINNAGAMVDPLYGNATSTAQGAYNAAVPQLQAAGQTAAGGFGNAQGYNQAATGLTLAGGQAIDPSQINGATIGQYLNPYLGTVLGSTAALINQNNQQAQAGQLGNAISSGAFGGDRSGIAAAVLAGQQQLAAGQTYSGIASDAYNQALATAQQQQGVQLSAEQANRAALQQTGEQMAAIGQQGFGQAQTEAQTQAALAQQGFGMGQSQAQTEAALAQGWQNAYLQEGQAQLGAGQVEQQTQQAGLTALYNQFLQQQSYPFQTAQFLANIAEGTGALSGSTTTAVQPQSFFSDERLKEDMEPIGKGFDGANIYRFRYKGDPTTRIGFSAQEVERRHPEAVHEVGGFKAVDQAAATEEAAERGGFAGAANDNHHEEPERVARQAGGYQGFGGVAYPAGVNQFDLAAMLQAQEGMYGPYSQAGLYGGQASGAPHGGSSYVPAANMPVSHLAAAEAPKMSQSGALHEAAQAAQDAQSIEKEGKQAVSWAKGKLGGGSGPDTSNLTSDFTPTAGAMGTRQADVPTPGADQQVDVTTFDSPPTSSDNSPPPSDGNARGGFINARRHRDEGGDVSDQNNADDPYAPKGPGLDIPDSAPHATLDPSKAPGALPSTLSQILGDVKDVASTASSFASMGAKHGGRQGFAAAGRIARQGGGPTGGDDPNSPSDISDTGLGAVMDAAGDAWRRWLAAPPPPQFHPSGPSKDAPAPAPAAPASPDTPVGTPIDPSQARQRPPGFTGAAPDQSWHSTDPFAVPPPAGGFGGAHHHARSAPAAAPAAAPAVPPPPGPPSLGPVVSPPPQDPASAVANAQSGQGPVDVSALNAGLAPAEAGFGGAASPAAGAATPGTPSSPKHGGIGNTIKNLAENLVGVDPKTGKFDADQLMHLFSGIAAMGATPTVHPLFALSQGLGGYANSYFNQQQQRATIQQTQASTAETQANTRNIDAEVLARVQASAHLPPNWVVRAGAGGAGQPTFRAEGTSYNPSGLWHGEPAMGGAGSPGSAAWNGQTQLTPDVAFDRYNRGVAGSPDQVKKNSDSIDNAMAGGFQASNNQVNDLETADTVNDLRHSKVTGDVLSPIKQRYLSMYNGFARMLGQPELLDPNLPLAQLQTKLQTLGAMADPATRASIEHLEQGLIGRPGNTLDPKAQALLAARILVGDRMQIDTANTYRDINNQTMGQSGVAKSFDTKDAALENVRRHSPGTYLTNVNDVASAMLDDNWKTWRGIMRRDPSDSGRQALIQRLDKRYGTGFAENYLTATGM